MRVFYGILENMIDITDICNTTLNIDNVITIPKGDADRAKYFTDPLPGVLKTVYVLTNENTQLTSYDHTCYITIDLQTLSVSASERDIKEDKLSNIHSRLKILYGSFTEEYPEQMMAISYIKGPEKVLEIGGNIGRNSLVIASLLNDDRNLVVLECDLNIANQLTQNKEINNLNFHIEPSALSKRKLVQRGWNTVPLLESSPESVSQCNVSNITYEELIQKYNMIFDTLVLDCEGAFYYILMDMPEILTNVNLIIMENDYLDYSHKQYVDALLLKNGFYRDYVQGGGWGPCESNFFEVWKK
jgi:FkbM family methyltransferase